MNKNISDKDKKDWQEFILNKKKLPNKDIKNQTQIFLKIKTIDLHGYTLDQANKVMEDFIIKSYNQNINNIILLQGKGFTEKKKKER